MTPERYRQVKEIFGEVCGKPATERAAYLDEACAVDAGLRAEVESLLAHDGESLPVDLGISPAGVLGLDGSQADGTDGRRPRPDLGIGDELPERVGRYRIIRQIGEGGMGCVFEAEQDNPRRTVALKLIRPGVASAQTLRRFKLEAHVLGSLQHAGIAQIYEAGTAEVQRHDGSAIEQPFFAMELIHGEPLTEFVQHGGLGVGALAGASCSETCSLAQRLELLARVCDAIDHAHQRGVIHRDLKPGNILVDEHGQPKILDFGVARVTAADAPLTTLHTDVGQLIGTLAYMSPEQVSGDSKDVGTRSDVYALGVVLFQLLTDKLPYDVSAKTIPEAVRTIAEQEPTPLGTLNRVYRGELSTIVGKALEKDPARRYPSAAALAEDLRRYLSHQPIAAHPATTLYQLRKFARRNPALVGGVVVAFVCLLIGVVGTTSQAIRATHARNQALEAERVAEQRRTEAEEQRAEAERQAALAQAVNEFLRDDLLAVASPEKERDRNITVRAVLDRAAAGIGGRFQGQPLVEAAIRATLGESYYGLGEYALAEPQMSRALELRKAEIGEESPLTLAAMHTLAGLYSNQARYAEAEALFVRTLELRRRILGADHRATLATMSLLALLYGRVGRDAEAEPLLLDVIERAQRTLGAEDRTTLIAQANLADVYVRQRRLAEAEPLYQQVLEAERRAWGEEVPGTLATMNNLANLYALQKRFAEAEPLCVRTLEIRWRVMGETHPQTLSSLNSLAVLYKRQGRYAEAEPLFIQALEAKRRELGDEHPNTLVSLNNLANLYAVQGRHAEAEQLFLQALEVRRRVLGENHPQTLSTIGNLVELYRTQGRDEEAAEWRAKLPATQAAAAKDRGPEGE